MIEFCRDRRKFGRDINCEETKEILSRHRKLYRDRVDKLKRKMSVATVSRGRSVKRTGCNKFGVATQDIPIATIKILLHQNYIAILSKSVATESKKKPKEQVISSQKVLF